MGSCLDQVTSMYNPACIILLQLALWVLPEMRSAVWRSASHGPAPVIQVKWDRHEQDGDHGE